MSKNYLYILLIAITVMMPFCTGPKTMAAVPDEKLLTVAKQRWPDATMQTLQAGHTVYTTKCNKCHGLKNIPKRSEDEWVEAIKDMAPRSKLTVEETEILSRYILSARVVK